MKKQSFILSALLLCILIAGCKERVHESLHIVMRNQTDSLIHIRVYPKAACLSDGGGLYRYSDEGGGYKNVEFSLSPYENQGLFNGFATLFVSKNLNIKPYALAEKVFDSIHIRTTNKDSVVIVIKFTHEHATGYSENIFSENSTWYYEIVEWDAQNQFHKNPQRDYRYSFLILEENFMEYPEDSNAAKANRLIFKDGKMD